MMTLFHFQNSERIRYMENRAGEYISNLSGKMVYRSFSPKPLPPDPPLDISKDIINLLVQANKRLITYRD